MKNIAAALLKAQKALDPIKKGRKGHNYKYADLAAVLDEVVQELNAVGVVVMQPIMPASQPHHARVDTILIHAESGETITSSAEVPWKSEARMNDAQSYGSAITYARRYALVSFMGVATEDDDGASAIKRRVEPDQSEQRAIDWALGYAEARASWDDKVGLDGENSAKIAAACKYPAARKVLADAGVPL